MIGSTFKKIRGTDKYENDKVIGFQFYKGRAGYGIALVHERRVMGPRRDEVETYVGPVARAEDYIKHQIPYVILKTIGDLLDYVIDPLLEFEKIKK